MDMRSLLQKLDELKIGDINPATGKRITGGMTDSDGNLVGSGTPGVYWNAQEEPVKDEPKPVKDEPKPVEEPVEFRPRPPAPPPLPNPVEPNNSLPEIPPEDKPKEEPCPPEVLAQIKYMPTFNKAYAAAKKSGCKEFEWCQRLVAGGQGATPEPMAAAVGNPNISRSTAPDNPNIRPGSLRDRAAKANAERRPDAPKFN